MHKSQINIFEQHMSDENKIPLIDLAERYPSLIISVKCSDLIDAFRCIIEESKLQSDKITKEESVETYLTEKEVQELLHTKHVTLWRWHKTGYLVHINIGRKIIYKKSDVDKILNNNK